MAKNYVIGDLQGCYDSLIELLNKIGAARDDVLWFVGDLVNRGPRSLEVLRLLYQERNRVKTVLGNHDVHLLRRYYQDAPPKAGDTLDDLLMAEDRPILIGWLAQQPFVMVDERWVVVHGGIHPFWTEQVLYQHQADLNGLFATAEGRSQYLPKIRTPSPIATMITMRAVDKKGELQSFKGPPQQLPAGLYPWFQHPERKPIRQRILFGHWSALGLVQNESVIGLDTGCVWGGALSAYCLEEDRIYQVVSQEL
jgi:bis(5'-nucleosyl)-tetraphosphatase (symmetrical)